jgi:hypothetical protein
MNFVKVDYRPIAVCEWATYDLLDGSVNDVYRQGEIEIAVSVHLSNMPSLPEDGKSSYQGDMLLTFTLEDDDIGDSINIQVPFEVDSDGTNYYLNASNGDPLAEIRIIRYKEPEETKD